MAQLCTRYMIMSLMLYPVELSGRLGMNPIGRTRRAVTRRSRGELWAGIVRFVKRSCALLATHRPAAIIS
jgi:hypothetical protein